VGGIAEGMRCLRNLQKGVFGMSSMRDFSKKEYLRPKKQIGSSEFVAWMVLISMGMALGFAFGYGLLYTGV
jgi:hypothetical protein